MTTPTALFLIITAFLTALLSGIFGMAGGLVLMGALALVLPVSAARNRAIVLTLVMLAITTGVGAQQPDSARALLQVAHRANWYVRAWRADSSTIEGRVPFVRDTSATIGRQAIAFADITAIDRRLRSGSLAPNSAVAGALPRWGVAGRDAGSDGQRAGKGGRRSRR